MAKKMLKMIYIGLIAVVCLVAVFIIVKNHKVSADSGVRVFVDKEPGEIKRISIKNEASEYEVFYDEAEGGYVFADFPVNIVDEEGFFELMNHSCGFGSLRTVEENPSDISIYGLDKPKATVNVEFLDGTGFGLKIGSEERISYNYYAQVEGDDSVYLFAQEDVAYFLIKKEAYISNQVTPALMVSSPLSAIRDITFSGSAFEKPIEIKAIAGADPETVLKAKSFGPATHIVKLNGTYELDQTYGIEILGSVMDIQALDVFGYNLSDSDLSKLGFDDPYIQVDFSLKNNTDYVADYQLKLIPAGQYYLASMKDSGLVFIVETPAFVSLDYTKLCMRWFLAPMRADLENVTIEYGDEKYVFVSETNENGETVATLNGQPLNIEIYYSFFRLVTSAASDGVYLENTENKGDPLMTITYNYAIEGKEPDVMKLYNGSVRRVNVDINGITEFDMKYSFVSAMKDACEKAVNNQPIEENWQ